MSSSKKRGGGMGFCCRPYSAGVLPSTVYLTRFRTYKIARPTSNKILRGEGASDRSTPAAKSLYRSFCIAWLNKIVSLHVLNILTRGFQKNIDSYWRPTQPVHLLTSCNEKISDIIRRKIRTRPIHLTLTIKSVKKLSDSAGYKYEFWLCIILYNY